MDWTQPVDIYCERTAVGLWNEPLNALSNIAFVLAALWAGRDARARHLTNPLLWVLIVLTALIGIGSGLFHTFANRWSELADTLPIWTFVALYILAAMHWLGGMAPRKVALWAGLIVAGGVAMGFLAGGEGGDASAVAAAPDPLNGSGQYAPALAALVIFSVITYLRHHPYRAWVWAATAAFLLSLTFRTFDIAVCTSFPLGLHYMWHTLNAVMIGALLQLLLRTMDEGGAAGEAPGEAVT